MKDVYADLKTDITIVVGDVGCKNCEALTTFLDEEELPYVFTTFKNLSKQTKKLVWKAKKESGLKEITFPFTMSTFTICFIDNFDIDTFKKTYFNH